jgi:hypothetical protein
MTWTMRRATRRLMLTLHIAVSVGWLGLDLGMLALGLTGLGSDDPETVRAAYRAMAVLADAVIIPISLLTLLTGVLLGLGTTWGLLRYWWVLVKLGITVGAALASLLALRSTIHHAVALLPAAGPVDVGAAAASLVAAPSVALCLYTAATVLSVYKPWGRRGQRRSAAQRRSAELSVAAPTVVP